MNFVQHFCKNRKCNRIFLDKDLGNNRGPVRWKYCPECVDFLGYENPKTPPKNQKVEADGMTRGERLKLAREQKKRLKAILEDL